jgi:hypothetical protein
MSKRTDGGPAQPARYVSDQPYGEGQELMTTQQAAPMAAAGTTGSVPAGDMGMLAQAPQGLFDPTDRPLTQGQPFGEGAGPEVLATGEPAPTRKELMASLPMLMMEAERADASPELRALVTYLQAQR